MITVAVCKTLENLSHNVSKQKERHVLTGTGKVSKSAYTTYGTNLLFLQFLNWVHLFFRPEIVILQL